MDSRVWIGRSDIYLFSSSYLLPRKGLGSNL